MCKVRMLLPVLLLIAVACQLFGCCSPGSARKHFRNVSGTSHLPDLTRATSTIFVATDSLPENLQVMTVTINDDDSINAAMDRLLVRLRGTDRNKPRLLPGGKAVAEGGMLHASGKTRKMSYTTELEGTDEYISIGLKTLQFVTIAEDPEDPGRGILIGVDTPDGKKKVRTTADALTSAPVTQYHGILILRLSAMLENGTYAEERLTAFGTIRLPNNFPAGFHTLNYPNGFRKQE